MDSSQRSPYFIPSRKTATPMIPSRTIAQRGRVRVAPPKALATSRPQGRVSTTITRNGGGDGGEPGQNAQQVIGKEGQEKGQDEESVCFGPDDGEVLVGNGPAHQAVRKRLAQRACQEKDQQGGGEDRGDGKKKGGPGAEEHPAGGGAEVAGDGGQHHRQELEQEKQRWE